MSVKLKELNHPIPVLQMEDGQIGIIRKWDALPNYIGRIVQRYGNDLITLGEASGLAWTSVFENKLLKVDYLVEILPPDTLLEI